MTRDDVRSQLSPGAQLIQDLLDQLRASGDPEAPRLIRMLLKDSFRLLQDERELVRRRQEAQTAEERDAVDRQIRERLAARVARP